MYKYFLIFWFGVISSCELCAQYEIKGVVIDEQSGISLVGASIYSEEYRKGVATDEVGRFNFKCSNTKEHLVKISFVGYEDMNLSLIPGDKVDTIYLNPSLSFNTVNITAQKKKYQIGKLSIPTKDLFKSVQFGGERDVFKSLQLLPSIKFGKEGSSNIFVRGGNVDENLIIIDNIPVLNSNHLFGLVSAINSNVVETTDVHSGALPAQYGGKLSSVLSLETAREFQKEWNGELGLGLISSKIHFTGPVVSDKVDLEVSARRSLIHLLSPLFGGEGGSSFGFYDYFIKTKIKLGENGRFTALMQNSKDWNNRLPTPEEQNKPEVFTNRLNWTNNLIGANIDFSFGDRLDSRTTIYHSAYNFGLAGSVENNTLESSRSSDYVSDMTILGVKQNWNLYLNNHQINFGVDGSKREYNPGLIRTILTTSEGEIDSSSTNLMIEDVSVRLYLEDEYKVGKLSVIAGVNLVNIFSENNTITAIEPRFRMSYTNSSSLIFNASAGIANQYFNIFNSSVLGLPTDSFVPTHTGLTNPNSTIFSAGFYKLLGDAYSVQTEFYYKSLEGLNTINPGSSLLLFGDDWQDRVLSSGEGTSFGVESLVRKNSGRLTGWLSLALSKTDRRFDGINEGEPFAFRFDRTVDLALVLSYAISKNLSVSMNWIYTTGEAATFPKGIYPSHQSGGIIGSSGASGIDGFFELPINNESNDPNNIIIYGNHNGDRFPAYHRLDISIEKRLKGWGLDQSFQLSIYNVYNRLNTFYVNQGYGNVEFNPFGEQNQKGNISSVSLFPIFPSLSYTIKL